jgi:geranylgeranyl reductase family protein
MQDFDVAIVGAGPAGCSSAITLAQLGYEVVLIDRAIFPREKLCGDFVNPINWPVLQQLDVSEDVLDRRHAKITRFLITSADGAQATSPLPSAGGRQFGLGLRRYDLDHALLERAKSLAVTVNEGSRVKTIAKHSRGWTVEIERGGERASLRAKLLVGADGRNSPLARRLGLVAGRQSGFVGFQIQLTQVSGVRDSVEIHQFAGGYAGLVRVDEDTVNLGFTVNQSLLGKPVSYPSLRQNFLCGNPFLRESLASGEPASELRSVWPVYFKARRCFGEGFILVGDAARVTEPVTGQGIFLALRSGQLGGRAIGEALRQKTSLRQYHRACRNEFGAGLRVNYLIGALAHRTKLLTPLIRFLGRRNEILRTLVSMVCRSRCIDGAG